MAKENNSHIDLCISLFYNNLAWDILAINAVRPFIQRNKEILSYGIYMSDKRGDHLELTLSVKKENARNVALQADTHFKSFLSKNPSVNILKEKKLEGIFMDYPNNTLHYGIYDDYHYHPEIMDIKKDYSDFLITIIENYGKDLVYDTNELFTQLLTILYNALPYNDDGKIKFFSDFMEEEQKKYPKAELEMIMVKSLQEFMENKKVLLDYFREYIGKKEYEDKFEAKWWEIISAFIQKHCTGIINKDIVLIGDVLRLLAISLNIKYYVSFYALFFKTIDYLSIENKKNIK